jgi:DnaK suppressor protein
LVAIGVSPVVIEDEDSRSGPNARSRTIRPMTAQSPDPHALLVAERKRLIAALAEGIVAPDPMTYGSQAAAASQVFDQQRDLALREKDQQHLEVVEAALARLDAGTFGTCVRCGRPIAPERLEALPWAAHCIDCQRIVGRGG